MSANILSSEDAIRVSILIVEAFIRMRKMIQENTKMAARLNDIEDRLGANEFQVFTMMDQIGTIKKKLIPAKLNKPKIGFSTSK